MDIFSEIEGLRGENLGSALLRYLIFNSQEVREGFLSLLSNSSPLGPLSYSTHFACRTEHHTFDENLGDGRLDILIQLDDAVIGVENKFFAQFQDGQPQKYLKTLNDVANSLSSINQTAIKSILYVLCPESRKAEAVEKINHLNHLNHLTKAEVITWEMVLSNFSLIEQVSNPTTQVVLREFTGYLKRHFSFIHDFKRKCPHLVRSLPEYGSPLQEEMIGKLWSFFPNAGGRMGKGKTWLGYNFYTDPEINQKGWFGFVPNEDLYGQVEGGASLIIATTFNPELSSDFVETKIKNENFIGAPGRTNTWVIKFNSNWDSVDVWREKLSPLWEAVKNEPNE